MTKLGGHLVGNALFSFVSDLCTLLLVMDLPW